MTLLADFTAMPVSSTTIALCLGIWFYEWNYRVSHETVGISYGKFVSGEYWRLVTASFSHLDMLHVAFNTASLYSCGVMEVKRGSWYYFQTSVLLVVLSMLIAMGIYHVLIHRFGRQHYENQMAVGYSCVVFGWMTILSLYQPTYAISLPGDVSLPISATPFISLLVTQLIVPRASFVGHAAGIMAGLVLGWNLFAWLTPYWFIMLMLYLGGWLAISVKATTRINVPFIVMHGAARARRSIRNGNVIAAVDFQQQQQQQQAEPYGDDWV